MLHLLPQYQKRKVINEYRMRLAVVLSLMIFGAAISFAVFTLPAYLTLHAEKSALESKKVAHQAVIEAGAAAAGVGGNDATKAVQILIPYKEALSPIVFIDAINKASAGVQIEGYSLTQASPGAPIATVVTGFAKSREGLTTFSKSLNDTFGNVKLPLSALAKQSDIPFEFRFEMKYPAVVKYVNSTSTIQ